MSIRKPRHTDAFLAVLLLSLSLVFALWSPVRATESKPEILTIQVEGTITSGTASLIQRGLTEASNQGNAAVILLINTPGGLVTATLDIVADLLNADVPVITYVSPQGAIAASAGSFILLAGHVAAMSPGTTCGAAMPVQINPEAGTTQAAEDKTIQFLAGHMRSIAKTRGRPPEIAEKFVTESLTLDAREALEKDVIDRIEPDLTTLLNRIHGTTVTVQGQSWPLNTQNATIRPLEMKFVEKMTNLLSDPQMAYILLLLGIYGLIIGFGAPETYVPEVLGVISLALGLYGLGLFETNLFAGILLTLGLGLLVAEVLTPTYGILTFGGLVCLVLGTLFLPAEPLMPRDWLVRFRFLATGVSVAGGIFMVIAMRAILRIRRRKAIQGTSEFDGRMARVISTLNPEGQVMIAGEIWRAVSQDGSTIEIGQTVQIIDRQGLVVRVQSLQKEE
ncbi:MAG: nodulation protein NfeD [Clostridia bacterium]|nr:nodulation protein NfeD [Clostridia bacterium]